MQIETMQQNNSLKEKISEETICRFSPKLAIAVYHNIADFYTVVNIIDTLKIGYKFYLQHRTIHTGKTVLFSQN